MLDWNESAWASLFVGVALKSTAVLGAAWLAAFLLRRQSAAARHLVWTTAFAALLALPFFSLSLPALSVPVARTFLPGVVFQATSTASADVLASRTRPPVNATVPPKSAPWRPDWGSSLMLLWALGGAVSFAHMLAACVVVGRMRRTAKLLNIPDLGVLARPLGLDREVSVLETPPGSMPMTFGLLRPAVFIPADAAEWSEERRRLVLLHELAHVRRRDTATHLLARIAMTLYWWNPLAWAAWREFLKERERAADDLVLACGTRASEYASHLLEIARSMQSPRMIGRVAVAMARPLQLEGRLLAILDANRNRNIPRRAFAVAGALLAACIVAPLAALQALPANVDAMIRAAVSQRNYQMLEDAVAVSEAAREYEIARKLLESSLAIRAEVFGTQSVGYGMGLLKLGDLERKHRNAQEAESRYTEAVSVLGNRPEAGRPLIALGIAALRRKEPDRAIEYFQRAQIANPAIAGPALRWMAMVREQENNISEAESLYQRALAIEDSDSAERATTVELYARFLRRQGRENEAASMQEQAAALRKAAGSQATLSRQRAAAAVYRAGGGVTPPSVIYKVEPEYTEEASVARYEGTVVVSVEIGKDGIARGMQVIRGLGLGLNEKAMEAITQWRFKPGVKDGQPVNVAAIIEVNYRLL
ncbi:MAG: TonB family protein [Bryobacteraceae bacterium]